MRNESMRNVAELNIY